MNCKQCEAALIEYAHDELTPAARLEVTLHLAECAGCAVAFCRLRADLDGVLLAAQKTPPAAVRERLRAEVERSFRPRWWRRALAQVRRPVPAYVVFAALAIPAVVWWMREFALSGEPGTETPRLRGYDAAAPLSMPREVL
ncbi:MAG TPA: zf-HC2 domain-containing protein [Nannocystis sp.]